MAPPGRIDLKAGTWIVPTERMKAKKEHRVTTVDASGGAAQGAATRDGVELVFPAPPGGQLSDMTLTAVLRRAASGLHRAWISQHVPRLGRDRTHHPRGYD